MNQLRYKNKVGKKHEFFEVWNLENQQEGIKEQVKVQERNKEEEDQEKGKRNKE